MEVIKSQRVIRVVDLDVGDGGVILFPETVGR